jgi:hypothetical protein
VSAAPARAVPPAELFIREIRKDGRALVVLRGVENGAGGVTVHSEVYPAGAKPGIEPRVRPFAFATREQALRFVDDALDALEYLNCYVVE